MSARISSPEEIRQRLADHYAQRGFILPQQGMMAVAMPDFQDGYTKLYAALTQQENHFSAYEREFVWMGILSAAGESVGTHHVKLFRDNGGTSNQMEVITGLVALAMGTPRSFEFMHRHWQKHFAPMNAVATYRGAISRLVSDSGIPLDLAWYLMLAVHTTFGHRWGVEQSLHALYDAGSHEGKMAESISLPFLAAGINRLIDASEIWLEMIRSGRISASEPFCIWAETSQIGGLKI
ncbi:hypothetical protein C7T35_21250 [Variovorax sp. WS11]|uniref:hypothetical protein n=1 Tax=Variovorax sp. WS11 TaxID=1105204 RepID=UPI000D0D6852|nr:hypothetical protein [Variovorax sp. WS11]NDZ18758.1 hypothetical protein [Variovorax sp. WS11]PSL82537.1 hypothetical protein C7T35_21250 [Variovorax sp. WS11]